MGKKKSKGQATQAGSGPIAGPSLQPENDTRNPVLRLTPIIRDRLSRNFDAESYTQPSQKAINKIIYVLFLPYLAAAASRPLSQFDIYRLAREKRAEAMSHIWSEAGGGETSFRVGRGPDTITIESPAVKAVRAMPVVTVAYHVWTLWTLGAFSVHSVRQTFIGALTDAKPPKAFQMSLGRKAVLNRICFDAFRPFTESIPGGVQSKEDIAKTVQQNFGALKDSVHALLASLDVEYKERVTGAAGWNDRSMIGKLHMLWEDGVFTSGVGRQKPLAPPLNYRRKAVTGFITKLAQRERDAMLIHDPAIRRQTLGIEEQQMTSNGPSLKEAAVGNDSLSMPELLRKCRRVCKEAKGPIEVKVIETVGNAIRLCRVLKDDKRRVSLEKAENEIRDISSSLDIHAAWVKQRVSEELEAFNKLVQKGIPTYFQSPSFRQVKERAILDEAQRDFEKFQEASSMKLLSVIKQLLDSSNEAYMIS
ncbi:hypothetical protein DL768_002147 [Monosporascus sp. mg162]|nr:hypothetical protein DL768_002147 [Monosporascus sp. mg162]